MSLRRPVVFVLSAACTAGAALGAACVIADPAPEVPIPPPSAPTILHGSVVPPATAILAEWPSEFVVPVHLDDPSLTFNYNVFIDYPAQSSLAFFGTVAPDTSLTDAGVRLVPFSVDQPSDDLCHTIEVVVALEFETNDQHTPAPPGGDSVAWFFNPGGNPGGCPIYDAGGLDGAFPPEPAMDAGSDADLEGGE